MDVKTIRYSTPMSAPKFHPAQLVSFTGGKGIVRSHKIEYGNWSYLIEMPLELAPAFGRIGAETMVFFTEVDLCVM